MELEPEVATVDIDKCVWCGKCAEACPFDAIEKRKLADKEVAYVTEALCKGCGACVPVCEQDAIEVKGYENSVIMGMIEQLIREAQDG